MRGDMADTGAGRTGDGTSARVRKLGLLSGGDGSEMPSRRCNGGEESSGRAPLLLAVLPKASAAAADTAETAAPFAPDTRGSVVRGKSSSDTSARLSSRRSPSSAPRTSVAATSLAGKTGSTGSAAAVLTPKSPKSSNDMIWGLTGGKACTRKNKTGCRENALRNSVVYSVCRGFSICNMSFLSFRFRDTPRKYEVVAPRQPRSSPVQLPPLLQPASPSSITRRSCRRGGCRVSWRRR